jgi:mono/diheme cytochrome c family protein
MGKRVTLLFIPALALTISLTAGLASARGRTASQQMESESRKTVLDGVFTAAQADRGKEAYAMNCSSCHTDDLSGMSAPPLKGPEFMNRWREDTIGNLFSYIEDNMPPRDRSNISEKSYLDIVAHILAVNMFPAGSEELQVDTLSSIRIVGKDGPAEVPEFSLVEVVGCLAQDPDKTWRLTKVSAPVRTRSEEEATPEELRASADKPLGTATLRLVYVDSLRPHFEPESHLGHKLHAKGYTLRNSRGDGLSVVRLAAVAPTCER